MQTRNRAGGAKVTAATFAQNSGLDVAGLLRKPILEDCGGSNAPFAICAANVSRFEASTYSAPLTNYLVSWRDPQGIEKLLASVAPSVPVQKRFSFKRLLNAQAFVSESDDIRAIGGSFKHVQYEAEEIDTRTYNKGLVMRVDQDEQVGDWQKRYSGYLAMRLLRNELRRAINMLIAAAKNLPVVWDGASNPDADMRAMLRRGKMGKTGGGAYDGSGLRANRILVGGEAWERRIDAYESDGDNAARFMRAGKSPAELGAYLRVPEVSVHDEIYQSAADAKSEILSNIVLSYSASEDVLKDDPSNIKRFVTPPTRPTAEEIEGNLAVHLEDHETYADIIVQHHSNIIVTTAEGIEQLTATAA